MTRSSLTRYAWLSIAAAVVTIVLKSLAYVLTGSIGLLSDAIESLVNLLAAFIALSMLMIAAKPPDEEHHFGHSKAEYFASGAEGILILVAAFGIGITAVQRIISPRQLEQVGTGLIVSTVASLINFGVSRVLLHIGRKFNSITLEADARHLMTDVWTSVAVIGGVAAVKLTGSVILDPVVAILVAVNIVLTGYKLIKRSISGLMDSALSGKDLQIISNVLDEYKKQGIQFHSIRTRQAAGRSFISIHVLVPGRWTTHRGHHLAERIEINISKALPGATVFTHLEPVDDPISFKDMELDRSQPEK
jgi:cation diffusion facilitator family transporter